jgi:hypothetical protein
MDVITKDPNFIDQICELSLNQVIYFPEKHTNSIRSMISGPIKQEHPNREFQTRTVASSSNPKEKVCRVRRIS